MYLKLFATLATLAVPAAMFAQASPEVINPVGSNLEDVFQVNYASNLQLGDAAINITNAGTAGGDICANIYVFSPDEQENNSDLRVRRSSCGASCSDQLTRR